MTRKRGFLRLDEDTDVHASEWGLPDYSADSRGDIKDTAMNYDPGWSPEPVLEEEEPKQLTLEELEKIQQDAYQEGLLLGKEAGFKQGYDKGKEQGLEAGHEEGITAGKEEGIEAGKQDIQTQVDALLSIVDQFTQPLELMSAQVEKQLVDMVLHLTKEVIHTEVETNPQVILDTVRETVASLPVVAIDIVIKLNPEDSALILDAYGEEALAERNWTLLSEPSLARGDVHIEAGDSQVSYQLEERVKAVFQNFCGANRHQRQL